MTTVSLFDVELLQQIEYYSNPDLMLACNDDPEHGEFCPAAYYDADDIKEMLSMWGYISCPLCLDEITGGC
jgi:hypothetical protein